MGYRAKIIVSFLFISVVGCVKNKEQEISVGANKSLFTLLSPKESGVNFTNSIKETVQFNFINYPYIFNGGGVAAGDINNDGLVDLYFSSNQNRNALYLNKGNLQFEDITEKANVLDEVGWSTGVTMVDINGNGLLDMYVCKSGALTNSKLRQNKLFINQGDNTFLEEAEKYKLNDSGFSTQAYFWDYDKDGDLDMYLVNHRPDFENNTQSLRKSDVEMDARFSDQLYRNDAGVYSNVTQSAGILNFTWGLSASISDFNNDGWPDIYVCNDFLEADNLYINNGDGTFSDDLQSYMRHISMNSMGSDIADFNNDGLLDLMVVEMSPSDYVRSKSNMPTMSSENFEKIIETGNHYQYMSNTLQLKAGKSRFSEIAQMAGVAKTDWSWSPLLADFDNDGLKDLFITNGIYLDLSNNDYRNNFKNKIKNGEQLSLNQAIAMVPSNKLSNYIFSNNGDLTFSNSTSSWGLEKPTFSNGATYADLDNDGDLELIVNNLDDKVLIYKNNSNNNFIKLKLEGNKMNSFGVGAEITIYQGSKLKLFQHYTSRGFQSSVSNYISIGLGKTEGIDSVKVIWPSGKVSFMNKVKPNQLYTIKESNAVVQKIIKVIPSPLLTSLKASDIGVDFEHKEQVYNDFKEQILLPHKLSQNGPFISTADINNDGADDFYIGGAAGQSGALYIQKGDGEFRRISNPFLNDKNFEDQQSSFLDYDNDGDFDLYVVSGSSEFEENDSLLLDRLYENIGLGEFIKTRNVLPKLKLNGQSISTSDYDKDGDVDIFIGGRQITNKYPYSPNSYFLINNNGVFQIDQANSSKEIMELGMITDAIFTDFDNDNDDDLLVVGEWAPIQVLENVNGRFTLKELPDLLRTTGMWFSIAANDIDKDGDQDYFIGNLGANSKYHVNMNSELHIYCDDFDGSGTFDVLLSSNYKGKLVPIRGRECSSQQLPKIATDYPDFSSFANAELAEIIGKDQLENAKHIKMDLLKSVFIENLGDGRFKLKVLPNTIQKSPIMGFEFIDLDNDGKDEILAIGNFYPTEVETIRYDAGSGNIIKYTDKDFEVLNPEITGFNPYLDMRDIKIIRTPSVGKIIFVSNNNGKVNVFYKK